MSPKEMEVLDNFLFRCWQMDWLKNDYKALEKEIDYYKSRESHWDEIEEDAKRIADENARLSNSVIELTNTETELENKVTELENQIDQLSNDNHVLKTAFITQKEQIEKMKNCGNCNGIVNGIRQEKCRFCMRSKLLSEWELAE